MQAVNLLKIVLLTAALIISPLAVGRDDSPIVATIAPVHSLLQAMLGEDETALLLLPPSSSPHSAFLPPSKARKLWKATALFYVHEELEVFLHKMLAVLPPTVRRVRLADSITVTVNNNSDNFHIWLDPHYAIKMSERIAKILSELNPQRRDIYESRLRHLRTRLQILDAEIAAMLLPWRDKPFAVAHDAYRHFVRRYQLQKPIIIGHAHGLVSAKDLAQAKQAMQTAGAICILGDQHLPSLEQTALINPIGAGLPIGAELYFKMMKKLARTISDCLERG